MHAMNEKAMIQYAHDRLTVWAHQRAMAMEGLGHSGISVSEAMRERAHGGSASTAPSRLTVTERHAGRQSEVLEVEQSVRSLEFHQRSIVEAVYLHAKSHREVGQMRGVTRQAIEKQLMAALVAIGRDLGFGDQVRRAARRARHGTVAVRPKVPSALSALRDRLRAGDVA